MSSTAATPLADGSTSALRHALTGLQFPLSAERREALRERVFGFVDDTKAQRWPIERIIVAVKRLANDAGLYASARVVSDAELAVGADSLMVEMVGWCIERFYTRRRVTVRAVGAWVFLLALALLMLWVVTT